MGTNYKKFPSLTSLDADQSSKDTYPLVGRNAILKERKNDHFVDVGFGRGKEYSKCIFAVTKAGLLCAFNDQRQLVKWMDLKVRSFFILYGQIYVTLVNI